MKLKHFDLHEFDSPDVQGSGQLMSEKLLKTLDEIREVYGKPIIINSGYRTEAHNAKVGGIMPDANGLGGSSHLKGLAVDIHCTTSQERHDLLQLFLLHNITRIGIAKTFIHIDVDEDKAQRVIWTY